MNITQKRYIGTVFLIIASLTAGAAGASLIIWWAVGSIDLTGVTRTPAARPTARVDFAKLTEIQRGAVTFYRVRAGATGLDAVPLPADRAGNGVVVTADGWLMTAASVLAGQTPLVAVFADRSVVLVTPANAIKDEATGLAFIRVSATHLSVAPFGDDRALHPGETMFAPDGMNVRSATVTAVRIIPADTRADFIESSDKLSRRIIIEGGTLPVGTGIANALGETVGIVVKDGQVVPMPYMSMVLGQLFRDGRIARSRAGVHYISTDLLPGTTTGMPATGALVTGGKLLRSIELRSAGERAGLRENDVILMVERDRVDADATFAELVAEYAPNATVELTVLRDGKEMKIPLTLK